jgi:hypothetical protein
MPNRLFRTYYLATYMPLPKWADRFSARRATCGRSRATVTLLLVALCSAGAAEASFSGAVESPQQNNSTLPVHVYVPAALRHANSFSPLHCPPRPIPTATPAHHVGPAFHANAGCSARAERDEWVDGTIDRITVTNYDEASAPVREHVDAGADGVLDRATEWHYDRLGRLVMRSIDTDADGEADNRMYHHYNRRHQVVTTRIFDGPGVEPRTVRSYSYDSDGNLTRRVSINADGYGNEAYSYYYSDDGYLAREALDRRIDGSFELLTTYNWSDGLLVRCDVDLLADGTVDTIYYYAYADRRLSYQEIDARARGTKERFQQFEYERHGWLSRIDTLVGETSDDSFLYAYDAFGRISVIRYITEHYTPYVERYRYYCE